MVVRRSRAVQYLVRERGMVRRIFKFFLLNRSFIRVNGGNIFSTIVIMMIYRLYRFAFCKFIVLRLRNEFQTFELRVSNRSPVVVMLTTLIVSLTRRLVSSNNDLIVCNKNELRLFFLTLLLRDNIMNGMRSRIARRHNLKRSSFC